jgi:hypothetical protein
MNIYTTQRLYMGAEKVKEKLHVHSLILSLSHQSTRQSFESSPLALLDQTGYTVTKVLSTDRGKGGKSVWHVRVHRTVF